jgi:hypothetical protein
MGGFGIGHFLSRQRISNLGWRDDHNDHRVLPCSGENANPGETERSHINSGRWSSGTKLFEIEKKTIYVFKNN